MSGAQPIHRTTGARGPVFPFASLAALWIVARVDSRAWRWEPVDLENKRAEFLDECRDFAAVESPAVSPTLDR